MVADAFSLDVQTCIYTKEKKDEKALWSENGAASDAGFCCKDETIQPEGRRQWLLRGGVPFKAAVCRHRHPGSNLYLWQYHGARPLRSASLRRNTSGKPIIWTVLGRTEDKFATAKLTPVKSDLVDAPYVKEFPFVVECSVVKIEKLWSHTMFIGEIKDVKVDEAVLGNVPAPDIANIQPMIFNPANCARSRHWQISGRCVFGGEEDKRINKMSVLWKQDRK